MTSSQTATPPADPPDVRGTWVSFSYLATWGFILYGLGTATPYLKADLGLTDFQAGLHASALSIGVLAAGLTADRVSRRVGTRWLPDLAVSIVGTGIALLAFAPGLPVSLRGAMLMGIGGGTRGTWINVRLSRAGGAGSRRLFAQANALSMITAGVAPVAVGLAASGLHAWRVALALPVVAYLTLAILRPREPGEGSSVRAPRSSLPRAYWFAWLLVCLVVSIEFSFVYWGSTIVTKQTGLSRADATVLGGLFVVGMFIGRAAIGRGMGAGRSPRALLSGGLVVALIGSSLVWISTVPVLSALGLFLGGLGTSLLYPIGISVALQSAPKAQFQAAARGTLASGIAVLLAPSTLGLAADVVGVVGAWPIISVLALVALGLVAVTPRTDGSQADPQAQ